MLLDVKLATKLFDKGIFTIVFQTTLQEMRKELAENEKCLSTTNQLSEKTAADSSKIEYLQVKSFFLHEKIEQLEKAVKLMQRSDDGCCIIS